MRGLLLALPLLPEQASTQARDVDRLGLFLTAFSVLLTLGIALAILYCIVRYRRRPGRTVGADISGSTLLELGWIGGPTLIALLMFAWGAKVYVALSTPPADAMEIYVVAKQWMWKVQHPGGHKEINELHVPRDRDIVLTLSTEDVIHSFFVPAFRVKADVVPGRYRRVWFRATRRGVYRLFCAEYCGTSHSGMTGWVTVMDPAEYEAWTRTGAATGTLATNGRKLFQALACDSCHRADAQGRGPVLAGLYGRAVPLRGGGTVVADDGYIRESILAPEARIVAGFEPIMPVFNGLISEDQLLLLLAYIKSLGVETPPHAADEPSGEAP